MIRSSKLHLAEVDESYGEHLGAALGISFQLLKAGIACAVHALLPGLCTRTASRCIARINARIASRGLAASSHISPVSALSGRAPDAAGLTEPRSPLLSS